VPNLPPHMIVILRRLRRDDGQGLIELIVALTILAIGIGAVLTVLTGSALSLQRSDQKGTALTLAETQLELYRNLAFADVRLDDAAWSSSPLTSATDPYFTAHASDSTIPSGAEAGEVVDTGTGINACAATLPPECEPVRTVTGPDHRRYRIDTYITPSPTTSDGTSGGTVVGNPTRQITVVVRNAELASLPILARNTSTFSDINAASFGGKSYPNLTLNVPQAWVTGTSGTSIPASSISVTVSNGLYPLTSGSTTGTLTIYVYQGASAPSAPCGSGAGWTQVGTATVDNGNVTYYSDGAATVAAGNTYWWWAHFSGDSSNNARSSRCSPAMTTTKVQASKWNPSISVTAPSAATTGVQIAGSSFTATLTNSSPGATGTIHIKYVLAASAPSSCPTGTELGTTSATGDGAYSQANAFTPSAGTYYWWATYDGDSSNDAVTSVCSSAMPSTIVGAGPSLVSMTMKDTNNNGKVDQVVATFDKTLGSCVAPCTAGWTLSNVPSGGTLSSVTTSGTTATLTIAEGGTAANTAVGTFTIAMDSSSGIVDTSGRHGSFSATAPSDGAAPVIASIQSLQSTGSAGNGKMEAGDKFVITFSEPVTGVPTAPTVTETRPNGGGNVTLSIAGLTSATPADTGSSGYLSSKNTSAGYAGATVMSVGNTVATITLGAVKSGTGTPAASSGLLKFIPLTPGTVKDGTGNALSAEYDTAATFKLF
jgi:type II secretory pathway pseudopilin PulG